MPGSKDTFLLIAGKVKELVAATKPAVAVMF
jgi:hypothetical protein